ncbi:hypothetical protein GCM10008967_37160 [Bacillus carboniphilus]|uniref:Fumarylacetoacetase-like C-terminal domain-containing protein n=1 Tax=Bacillus carboniphilus TaxID=86663 RepID=A0ABP3GE77_9BACI
MRLATIKINETEQAAVFLEDRYYSLEQINNQYNKTGDITILGIIQNEQLEELTEWFNSEGKVALRDLPIEVSLSKEEVIYSPLYRYPSKIWGIGLNYVDHASDLNEIAPQEEPASFMKPTTSVIGMNDTIQIPKQSNRTTAEAELGVIIGKKCKDVSESDAQHYIAGFTTIIDMTAEDILQKNPRYLTRSKSFDTFFSFGPQLVTPDEVEDVMQLKVSTIKNKTEVRSNIVQNMTFNPWFLVSFHSEVMTLLPGDIISTGTPGAIVINDGDEVECQIDGFEVLRNRVRDLK